MQTEEEKAALRNFAWRRFVGRGIDECVGTFLIVGAVVALNAVFMTETVDDESGTAVAEGIAALVSLLLIVFAMPLSIFFSSIQYACFRTTLGKALCGVKVCDERGISISRWGFLWRDFKVLLIGDGLRLWVLALIANLIQYGKVCDGMSSTYDRKSPYKARPTREKRWYDGFLIVVWMILAVAQAVAMFALAA